MAFSDFLTILVRNKELNSEFKNLGKKQLEKMENFALAHLDRYKQKIEIDNLYKNKLKTIDDLTQRRLKELMPKTYFE